MNNRQLLPESNTPAERYPNRFKPGQSGNPGGRPKKTPEELKAVAELKRMTPEAVKVVVKILKNEHASLYARLQAAEIIFNRAMGRPETYLKVDNTEMSVEEAAARLQVLFGSGGDDSDSDASDEAENSGRSAEDVPMASDDAPAALTAVASPASPAVSSAAEQEVNDHVAS